MKYWAQRARRHWQENHPDRYAALDDPDSFFAKLGQEAAARYEVIRDILLEGRSPHDGTTTWTEYAGLVAQADQTAHELVESELLGAAGGAPDPT